MSRNTSPKILHFSERPPGSRTWPGFHLGAILASCKVTRASFLAPQPRGLRGEKSDTETKKVSTQHVESDSEWCIVDISHTQYLVKRKKERKKKAEGEGKTATFSWEAPYLTACVIFIRPRTERSVWWLTRPLLLTHRETVLNKEQTKGWKEGKPQCITI